MKIGIDIMGGDFAPKKTVLGAIIAKKDLPSDIQILLFGNKQATNFPLQHVNIAQSRHFNATRLMIK